MSNPSVAAIQSGLAGLGYDSGPQDGLFGPRTRAAAEGWLAAGGKGRAAPIAAPAQAPAASGPMLYQGAARYPVREIVVHCSATRPEWMAEAGLRAGD